ncbi:MAG: hypothetical protein ACI4CS_00170 [Candidatus Weimeria sp.]
MEQRKGYRFPEAEENAILSCVDSDFFDRIDRIAPALAREAGYSYETMNAYDQRDCMYATIRVMLPDVIEKKDINLSEVYEDRMQDITGRIYNRYVLNRLADRGYLKRDGMGKPVVTKKNFFVVWMILHGELRLEDA